MNNILLDIINQYSPSFVWPLCFAIGFLIVSFVFFCDERDSFSGFFGAILLFGAILSGAITWMNYNAGKEFLNIYLSDDFVVCRSDKSFYLSIPGKQIKQQVKDREFMVEQKEISSFALPEEKFAELISKLESARKSFESKQTQDH